MDARSWITLLLLALIWGSSFLLIKIGVAEISPIWVVAARTFAGSLFLLALMRWRRESLPGRSLWPALVVVAFFNNVVPFTLIAWGELWIASGVAAILNATTPLFSVLISTSVGDERLSVPKVVGIVVGFVGVVVLIGAGVREFTQGLLGQLAIVAASASYAIGALYVRRWLKGGRPIPLATGQLLLATLMSLPFALLPANLPQAMPSPLAVASITALGLLGSGLAYVLYYRLIAVVGATRTLLVTYLLPITALFWGWLFLDETITVRTLLGMALIFSGILLVNRERPLP
ncbi:MAG TPA: DMT family transporter, partial [Ardenticatenaceae bacterium]|nr:DMT family transporter [Ardenticatenaceae bacterium]